MNRVRISAIQMNSGNDLQGNLEALSSLLCEAAGDGASLVVLPENFAVFGADSQRDTAACLEEILAWLADSCRRLGIWLVAGSIPALHRPDGSPVPDGRVRSACYVLDEQGEVRGRYDKIHLFDVEVADRQSSYRESAVFEPGDRPVTIDTPWGRLGLGICYDIRFPELFGRLRQEGAEILVVPAAFTAVTGAAHWEVLLRARAIETQCFVVGAAQAGRHGPVRETLGHSLIADPWGRVLAQRAEPSAGVVTADCDREELAEIRSRMPLLSHRRLSY